MRRSSIATLIILSLPTLAQADIQSSVQAVSNSGGNWVGSGGTVTTGDSRASVHVTTRSDSRSSTSIEIRTETNGSVYEQSFSGDEASEIRVEATPSRTILETRAAPAAPVRREVIETPRPAEASSAGASSGIYIETNAQASTSQEAPAGLGARIVSVIREFFAGLFGWIK